MILREYSLVKDFPALLLALYKRGSAILFWFRFRWHRFSRNLSLVVFVDKTNSNIALRVFHHFFCFNSWRTRWSDRGSSTRNTFAPCNWLLSNSPWDMCLKNNSRRITYGIECVWGMPSLSPLSSLGIMYKTWTSVWICCGVAVFKRHCR